MTRESMGTRAQRINGTASLLLAVSFLCTSACTGSFLEPKPTVPPNSDDRLTLRGRVCTQPPDPNGFPVKVVLVVDQSGSMCISDPPGSQEQPGLCERLADDGIIPSGITEPARVRALRALIDQFRNQPNVQISIVPFETNVKNVWPANASGSRFAAPDDTLNAYLASIQSQLGKGTDYQGAMSYAYGVISSDIQRVAENNPELLPRSRYVVVFLTDGTPYPRCSANDSLNPFADPDHPSLTWADSASAGDFCNLLDPDSPDEIGGFLPGTDRNQNYQIFSYVDRIMELKEQYNIGDLRLHTVLLFNQAAVEACGAICTDIYGVYPTVPQAQYPAAAKKIATWTLQQMAQRGNGVYQEFLNSQILSIGLGALNYASLGSKNVLKTLILQSLTSVPGVDKRKVDSDGDGLPDEVDNVKGTAATNSFEADSDADCLDDNFEYRRADQGFRASNDKDTRGCDPASPLTLGCACSDTDGDGLSQFAEDYVKTRTGLVDSDGDGIPDGMEIRYRLSALEADLEGLDTDGDGIPDASEFKANTDPTARDRALYEREGYQYQTVEQLQADGSVCYDFTVSNVQLVTPPNQAGTRQGFNLFKLWFGESPSSGVATDYGAWRTACAWAQYDPPGIRVPAGPELVFQNSNFYSPERMSGRPATYRNLCVGSPP